MLVAPTTLAAAATQGKWDPTLVAVSVVRMTLVAAATPALLVQQVAVRTSPVACCYHCAHAISIAACAQLLLLYDTLGSILYTCFEYADCNLQHCLYENIGNQVGFPCLACNCFCHPSCPAPMYSLYLLSSCRYCFCCLLNCSSATVAMTPSSNKLISVPLCSR